MATGLLTPILLKGIRSTYFFNGRLLTAEDLRQEQEANRQQRQLLGQAIGEGVVCGLEVTQPLGMASARTVKVTAGLAVNRAGQALCLPDDQPEVELVAAPADEAETGVFFACDRPPGTAIPSGTGVYVLVLAPASGFELQAPVNALSRGNPAPGCGSRFEVQGVQFRLLALSTGALPVPGNKDTLRNRLAHYCLGTAVTGTFGQDPFDSETLSAYGPLDALRDSGDLTDCDVPLALVYWSGSGVQFVDMWSVRRRPVPCLAASAWPIPIGARRLAEAEAAFLQFQDQLAAFPEGVGRADIMAKAHFRYLPPAGLLPIGGDNFRLQSFFAGLPVQIEPNWLDPAFLRVPLLQSWFMEPMDLADPPDIRLYGQPDLDYVLFFRDQEFRLLHEAEPPVAVGQPQGAPGGGPPAPAEGAIQVTVKLPGKRLGLSLAQGREFRLWAEDDLGNEYQAIQVARDAGAGLGQGQGQGKGIAFVKGRAVFRVTGLPAGMYTVFLRASGFTPADKQCYVSAGQTAQVGFMLVEESAGLGAGGKKPPDSAPGGWIGKEGWFDRVQIVDAYRRWPWPQVDWPNPPVDPPPEEWWFDEQAVDPLPDEAAGWLKDWGAWLKAGNPDIPVDAGGIAVYVDPEHVPGAVADQPYAYAAFGRGGAYVPLVLIPAGTALARPVSVKDAGVSGLDLGAADKLAASGAADVDVLAASWTGLVADALGVVPTAAAGVIADARDAAGRLQGTLRVLTGVDANLESSLKEAGIADAVALANADPEKLFGSLEGRVSAAFARRLVDEARQMVPEGAWSLETADLDLGSQRLAALAGLGIHTRGDWLAAGADTLAHALGISPEQAKLMTGAIEQQKTAAQADATVGRSAGAPVTELFGVSRDAGVSLARLGFGSIGALEMADAGAVAAAFGGDALKAQAAIAAAKTRMDAIRGRG